MTAEIGTAAFAEGEGVGECAGRLTERADVVAAIEAHAAAIVRLRSPERLQAHSRMLPSQEEIDEAAFAAQQLRVVARDIQQGLHEGSAFAVARVGAA